MDILLRKTHPGRQQPNRLSKNEHTPYPLLASFLAPVSIRSTKQATGKKKIIPDKMSAICPLF